MMVEGFGSIEPIAKRSGKAVQQAVFLSRTNGYAFQAPGTNMSGSRFALPSAVAAVAVRRRADPGFGCVPRVFHSSVFGSGRSPWARILLFPNGR